jgi:hypothetical protein
MISRAISAVRRCVPRYCCSDTRLAGSNFETHVFIGILEYVGKVDTFQSFDPVICFRDVGTVDSTGASVRNVRKFYYSTEEIPEYKWLSRCLKLILTKQDFRVWTEFVWPRVVHASTIGSRPSGFLRCGECLGELMGCQLFNKESASWNFSLAIL